MPNGEAQPFPECPQCDGVLVPLSDFGSQGASILYKAWVCTSVPNCNMNIKIRNGDVIINEPIMSSNNDNSPIKISKLNKINLITPVE